MTSETQTRTRPTAHTFEQVNWENAEQETRIGVLQEMVAILLNRLDDRDAALREQTRITVDAVKEVALAFWTDESVKNDYTFHPSLLWRFLDEVAALPHDSTPGEATGVDPTCEERGHVHRHRYGPQYHDECDITDRAVRTQGEPPQGDGPDAKA